MKLDTKKLYCALMIIFPVVLQCMGTSTDSDLSITPYCEKRDFTAILKILSENPRLKYSQETQPQEPCTTVPPLHQFLKNRQTTCLFERCALKIINKSYAHVLRLKEKTVGFVCFSSTLKKHLTDSTTQSSGNIIIVALARAFERTEYQEQLIRHAIETLQQEPGLNQIEATVRNECTTLRDFYRRLSFTPSQEDSSKNYSVYTFTPQHTR